MEFTASVVIDRTSDVVNDALMEPKNFPYWQTDLERFEVVKKRPGMVGSAGRLHYVQNGKRYVMEDRMILCEPGKRYVSKVSGDAIEARVETVLRKKGKRTEMTIRWDGKAKPFILRLLLPFMKGRMIRQTKAELNTFKRLVETKGSDFSASSED